jgi:hypothetical protein
MIDCIREDLIEDAAFFMNPKFHSESLLLEAKRYANLFVL